MAVTDWAAKRQRKKDVGFYIGEKKRLLTVKVGMGPTVSVEACAVPRTGVGLT